MSWRDKYMEVDALIGKTLSKIERDGDEEILFHTTDGETYKMYHEQSCCESVTIEDIVGDLDNLVDSPILMAEETTENGEPEKDEDGYCWDDSSTWTFYKFATNKGYVTIRWYGSSNGYYSETVDFVLVNNEEY